MSEGGPDPRHEVTTRTADGTASLGAEIARSLRPGDVVIVSGELGAGKSTLIRGAARALGVTGAVPSPSFTLGRRYVGAEADVSHLDLYRLATLEGEDPSLLHDYLTADAISFVEWPEVAEPEIRSTAAANGGRVIEVAIEPGGELERIVEIQGA
jgi:tRNA threonylcarbamoyladenosine biosynthesis protein TsaE